MGRASGCSLLWTNRPTLSDCVSDMREFYSAITCTELIWRRRRRRRERLEIYQNINFISFCLLFTAGVTILLKWKSQRAILSVTLPGAVRAFDLHRNRNRCHKILAQHPKFKNKQWIPYHSSLPPVAATKTNGASDARLFEFLVNSTTAKAIISDMCHTWLR